MDSISLELGGKSFKLKFGLKLFRILGEKWKLPGINEVVAKISILDQANSNLTFEQLDVLEDLISCAIYAGGTDYSKLKGIEIIDEFFKNPSALQDLTKQLIESLPQQETDENLGK